MKFLDYHYRFSAGSIHKFEADAKIAVVGEIACRIRFLSDYVDVKPLCISGADLFSSLCARALDSFTRNTGDVFDFEGLKVLVGEPVSFQVLGDRDGYRVPDVLHKAQQQAFHDGLVCVTVQGNSNDFKPSSSYGSGLVEDDIRHIARDFELLWVSEDDAVPCSHTTCDKNDHRNSKTDSAWA
jgi:hypothetical protein